MVAVYIDHLAQQLATSYPVPSLNLWGTKALVNAGDVPNKLTTCRHKRHVFNGGLGGGGVASDNIRVNFVYVMF